MDVLFKKGQLKELFDANGALKSGVTPVNGAIYFAINKEDSGEERGKLYLGEDNKLIPVGEDVVLKTVETTGELPTASLHKNEFYYCTSGNILAYSNGSTWVQVNTNTALTASGQNAAVTASGNGAHVVSIVRDSAGHESEGSFNILGGTNVSVSTSGQNVTLAAQDTLYDLGATSAGEDTNSRSLGANINLSGTVSGATGTVSTDTVVIKSTPSVIAAVNGNGEIELSVDTSGVGSVTGVDFGGGQVDSTHDHLITGDSALQGFHISVSDSSGGGTTHADNLNPGISVLNANGAAEDPVRFVASAKDDKSPIAALDVYSRSAINTKLDQLKNTINAMTYRGGAGSLAAVTTPSGGLHNGDVFVATGDINFSGYTTDAETQAHNGYLIIVSGTENDNGVIADPTTATYTVIKSSDTDTTYTVSGIANGIQINEVQSGSAANAIGSLTISEGTAISVSSDGTNAKTVTVAHANVAHTASTASAIVTGTSTANSDGSILTSFDTITGVTVNDQGHVTNVTTSTIRVTDTQLKTATASVTATGTDLATGYTATVTTELEDTAKNTASASFSLQSNTLEMSASGTQVAINLVWGSF